MKNVNENLMKAYSVTKYSDGSYCLRDIDSPSSTWFIAKKAISFIGKRYGCGGRKLVKLKRICERCVTEDWCLNFYFNPETYDYRAEIIENISSEYENSPLYHVSKGADETFYLDKGDNRLSLYHCITLGKDYIIDRRKDMGNWQKYISEDDLLILSETIQILREAHEKGLQVKFGLVKRRPKVKMIEAA